MTNEEAEGLIKRAESRLMAEYVTPARVLAGVAIGFAPTALLPDFSFMGVVSGALGFLSLMLWRGARDVRRDNTKIKALAIWNELSQRDAFHSYQFKQTWLLQNQLRELYANDPRGEILPLTQAIRLISSHVRQQERLQIVEHRLVQLQLIHNTMRQKLKQLRALGEDAPEVERKLLQIERDEAALENIAAQISASCARLEAIFTGVQHAHQVRQLKRELGELSRDVSSESSELALENDAFDIERQIGREIETFLRLERETDEHLRDV